jgi:hypothetical protein
MFSPSDEDYLYYDVDRTLGDDPGVYEHAFFACYKIPCKAIPVYPMIIRVSPPSNIRLPNSITLKNGNLESHIILEGRICDAELLLNSEDGSLLSTTDQSFFHISHDFNDFAVNESVLQQTLCLRITAVCGAVTSKGISCKNKTKHRTEKCHFHRSQCEIIGP